ncbi:hypothetical protein ACT691_05695 [Vibrio metschnikovii]
MEHKNGPIGEGADEIFGGIFTFHKAPNAQEFHEESQSVGCSH